MATRTNRKTSAPRRAAARARTRARAPRVAVVPATMKAAVIDRFGPPDAITLRTVPTPVVGPGEILIALHAAGVGIWDVKIRDGAWAEGNEGFPLILGTDGAGTVAGVGPRVRGFDLDEPVWAYAYENDKGGFYSEYVVVAAENAARCPAPLDLLHAGCTPAPAR